MSFDDDYDPSDPPTCPLCGEPANYRCTACGWVKQGAAVAVMEAQAEAVAQETPEPPQEPIPALLASRLCFLTGRAGTGKTFLAKRMVKEWDGTILAATTGIAAVNLGEGTTINALLRYFDTASLQDMYMSGRLTQTMANLATAGVKRIVIDEVSMMDGRQLTYLTKAVSEVAGTTIGVDTDLADRLRKKGVEPISLVLTGDFCQLPPVKAQYAFEVPEWVHYAEAMHRLTVVRRQTDLQFIDALNAAREGRGGDCASFFQGRMSPTIDLNFDGTTILAKNDAVARFNDLRLSQLTTDLVEFQSRKWGTPRADWKDIPDHFDLRVGALVMMLANCRTMGEEGRPGRIIYANGDTGHVEHIDIDRGILFVKLLRNGRTVEVEWIQRQNTILLETDRRKELIKLDAEHLIVGDGKMELIGTIDYLPVRVAYATTVHKSQGLTLDRVQIDISDGFFKAPAMTYVALSRARTSEGLRLVGSLDMLRNRCTIDGKVKPWL